MKYCRIILSIIIFSVVGSLSAQQVSVSEAQSRARGFLQSQEARRGAHRGSDGAKDLQLVYTRERMTDARPLYYVFDQKWDNGFVIVGGDEKAREVLFYCDHGHFDAAELPDNFRWWLEQLEGDISRAIDQGEAQENLPKTRASRRSVDELMQTRWSQSAPYWNAIPKLGDNYNNFVTGCVATAMAQVMKYHEYPVSGKGSHSYSWHFLTDGGDANANDTLKTGPEMTFSTDFSAHAYDWGAMAITYSSTSGDVEANEAVAQLMYDCGVAVDMQYGTTASGAYPSGIQPAMVQYFDYDKASRYVRRLYYSDEEWEELIYNEIANQRPVIYGGRTASNTGHQFVCDGYDAYLDMFHFNWGWNGSYDGYCPLTGAKALLPGGTGIGGGGAEEAYTISQDAVIGVKPNQGGKEALNVWQYAAYGQSGYAVSHNGETISHIVYSEDGSCMLNLAMRIVNYSTTYRNFALGVKAIDRNSGTEHIWPDLCNCQLQFGYHEDTGTMTFDLSDLRYNGIYDIVPVVRPNDANWDGTWTEISMYATTDYATVAVTCREATDAQDITFAISDTQVEAYRTLQITHPEAYTGEITYTSSDPEVAIVDAHGIVTGVKSGRATITVSGEDMYFADNLLFRATTAKFDIEVIDVIRSAPNVTISATTLDVGGNVTIVVTEGYDGEAKYFSSDPQIATVADGVVTGVAAGKTMITVVLPETNLWSGKTVAFEIEVLEAPELYMPYAPYFSNDNNPYVDDQELYVSVINNTSEKQTAIFVYDVYEVLADGKELRIGYDGYYLNDISANGAETYSFSLSKIRLVNKDRPIVPSQKYKILFYNDTKFANHWNYEEIYFTYRNKVDIPYTITSVGIGTLILPFDARLPHGWHAYSCDGVRGDGTLVMTNAESIKRNNPYIIMGDAGSTTFVGPDAVDDDYYTVGLLTGALTDKVRFQAGDYVLQNHDGHAAFYAFDPEHPNPNNGMCKPNRAFVHLDCISNNLMMYDIDPEVMAIGSVFDDQLKQLPAGVYGMDGVRRSALLPGMNIVIDSDGNARKCWLKD